MFRIIGKEGLTKIELIGKYKVLSRLYNLSKIDNALNNGEVDEDVLEVYKLVIEKFYRRYPNFKGLELKETYGIPVDNGVTQEIRSYNYPELELPNFPYYEELLYLNTLCNKILKRELFPTMVGQIYYRVGYKNSFYKVINLDYKYGYEQTFILQNVNTKSDVLVANVSEWSCGKLSGHDWCCNYEMSIKWHLDRVNKNYNSTKKDLENILDNVKEACLCDLNVNLQTEPGTWLKFRNDDNTFGRLTEKPTLENFPNVKNVLRITVDGCVYDASSWEILV